MVSNELRRARASEVVPDFDLISAIALKAEALLGYSALRKRLGIHPASLTRTLEELGIDPFLKEDVKEYTSPGNLFTIRASGAPNSTIKI
jgi:hypothetical protein